MRNGRMALPSLAARSRGALRTARVLTFVTFLLRLSAAYVQTSNAEALARLDNGAIDTHVSIRPPFLGTEGGGKQVSVARSSISRVLPNERAPDEGSLLMGARSARSDRCGFVPHAV